MSVPDIAGVTLFEDEVLCLNVDLGPHVLMKGSRGSFGLPVEAYTRLFAVRDGQPLAEIGEPQDLARFVAAVDTLAQALAFVDLFTSPSTHFLFTSHRHAIELTVREADRPAGPGAIKPEAVEGWSLELASAQEEPERFVIARNLLVRREDDLEVRRVREEVRRDGTYAQTHSASVRRVSPVDVIFPVYE